VADGKAAKFVGAGVSPLTAFAATCQFIVIGNAIRVRIERVAVKGI
jgi:hypothetical protein